MTDRLKREVNLRQHLAAAGVEFKGEAARCPFHDDSNPSLSVNQNDGVWLFHCHGCGASGSIIDYEMKARGVDVGRAIAMLAEQYGLATASQLPTQGRDDSARAPVEIFKEGIARLYRDARRRFIDNRTPAAVRFLQTKGLNRELAIRCGLGAIHFTKGTYRELKRDCESRYGYGMKELGLGGLFLYAKRGITVFVYPYWPDYAPPDFSRPTENLPPVKFIKFRPCVSRADADRLEVPRHFKPKGHACADPWCPVGLPPNGGELWITEGETDALTLALLGKHVAAVSGASMKLPKSMLRQLRERDISVNVVYDRDGAGEKARCDRARELEEAGVGYQVYQLPDSINGREDWGKDLNDLYLTLPQDRRSTLVELLVPVQATQPSVGTNGKQVGTGASADAIVVNELQRSEVVERAWKALLARNDPPRLFQQGTGLAYLGIEPDDMVRPDRDRTPAILPVTDAVMNGMLIRASSWLRKTESDCVPVRPPQDIVSDLVQYRPLPAWLPNLESVTSTPTYGPDLDLITPGYHPELRLAYLPAIEFAPPVNPSRQQLDQALEMIDRLLRDFPFATPADRANQIGVMVLSLLRPAIVGNVPLVMVTATIQRSGKGALCSLTEILMTGASAPAAQYSGDQEEFRKALLPYISSGAPAIRLDNIADGSELSSPSLASALTEGRYSDRVLGVSETRTVPVRSVFLATGNRISLSRDLIDRAVWIRLNPDTDRPDQRTFSIEGIEDHVREHRLEYLTAFATMVEWWKAQGAPRATARRMNGFNPFVQIIGGVLDACGITGFLGNADERHDTGEPAEAEWRRVLNRWDAQTNAVRTASWLLENVFERCEPLAYININGKEPRGRARSLSRLLGREAGRPRSLDDGRVVHIAQGGHEPNHNVATFGLVCVTPGGPGISAPPDEYPGISRCRIRPQNPESRDTGIPRIISNLNGYQEGLPLLRGCGTAPAGDPGNIPDIPVSAETAPPMRSMAPGYFRDTNGPGSPYPGEPEDVAESAGPLSDGQPRPPPAGIAELPEAARYDYEERAAFLEHMGGLPVESAEARARDEVIARWHQGRPGTENDGKHR